MPGAGGRRWVRGQDKVHLRYQAAGHGDDDLFRPRRGPRGGEGDVMPDLPARPDLDQLRHQAEALRRAAQRGDPDWTARIGTVSRRLILSSAQLALAGEYGFASWAKLKLEVERRDILNSRNLSRLTRLLAEHPELATRPMEHWADRQHGEPLGYITIMQVNHDRLGLPRALSGARAIASALIPARAPCDGPPGCKERALI